jgi:hypothetical protein
MYQYDETVIVQTAENDPRFHCGSIPLPFLKTATRQLQRHYAPMSFLRFGHGSLIRANLH